MLLCGLPGYTPSGLPLDHVVLTVALISTICDSKSERLKKNDNGGSSWSSKGIQIVSPRVFLEVLQR
jgi:hypothetical protein